MEMDVLGRSFARVRRLVAIAALSIVASSAQAIPITINFDGVLELTDYGEFVMGYGLVDGDIVTGSTTLDDLYIPATGPAEVFDFISLEIDLGGLYTVTGDPYFGDSLFFQDGFLTGINIFGAPLEPEDPGFSLYFGTGTGFSIEDLDDVVAEGNWNLPPQGAVQVNEPGTLALLGAGLLALVSIRRRRRLGS